MTSKIYLTKSQQLSQTRKNRILFIPTIKIIEQNHQTTNHLPDHILDDDSSDDSNDDNAIAAPNAGATDEPSGPVSLLQSLADEVSESLKKETTADLEISALKNRKVPTVIKPTSKTLSKFLPQFSSSIQLSKTSIKCFK